MNKKLKYTIFGQILHTLTSHAGIAVMFAFLWLIMIAVWTTKIGGYAFGIIGILTYFLAIYNAGCDAALDDKKPYSPLTPKPAKGLILPVLLTAVNILFIVLYKCSWAFGSTDGYIKEVWAIIGNILSILWFSMYKTFLGMERGHFELQGYLIILILPFIASALGYFAGYNGYDIYGKLNSLAYEKSKKKKKK
ncbi:MAG: hypothetical protein J6C82_02845 [Clostridia bacterium]|nr:hypothetical protein [Clostridia bacterium]